MTDTTLTWKKALRLAGDAGIELSDARLLLAHAGCVDLNTLILYGNEPMPADAYDRYLEYIEKRQSHLPVQYITGEACFCGIDLHVDQNVLIPRPETELLAEMVFKNCENKTVLDLCTGSGCIAVAILKLGRPAKVTACDISEKALLIAGKNAENNGADVEFLKGDMFFAVGTRKFDIIVSNPPYIATAEIDSLQPEVRDFEPGIALDGDTDGLRFYRVIAGNAKAHLNPFGKLFLEIGEDQGKTVPALLKDAGFENVEVKKDYSGLDRFVIAAC